MIYRAEKTLKAEMATPEAVRDTKQTLTDKIRSDAAADGRELYGGLRETLRHRMRNTPYGPVPFLVVLSVESDSTKADHDQPA